MVVPAGEFLTGALFLKSHIELHLMMGATLLFSDRQEDYPVVASRWEGVNRDVYASCLYAEDAEQIAVTGYGTIDGNGEEWWHVFRNEPDRLLYPRPKLISFDRCKGITLRDVHLKDSPSWTVNPIRSENITIDKEGFREATAISLLYMFAGTVLIVDLLFVTQWYVKGLLFLLLFAYGLSLLFIFPVMANYNVKGMFFKIKTAFWIGLSFLQYAINQVVAECIPESERFIPIVLNDEMQATILAFPETEEEPERKIAKYYESIQQAVKENLHATASRIPMTGSGGLCRH